MLMSGKDKPARLHYMPYSFRVLSPGDHVSKVDQAERLLAGLIGRHHLLRAGD